MKKSSLTRKNKLFKKIISMDWIASFRVYRDCCEIVFFRHSERSEESLIDEILRRSTSQNDANRHFATAPYTK